MAALGDVHVGGGDGCDAGHAGRDPVGSAGAGAEAEGEPEVRAAAGLGLARLASGFEAVKLRFADTALPAREDGHWRPARYPR
eukprot:5421180-Pleurochrysis_carterae.AAC.1